MDIWDSNRKIIGKECFSFDRKSRSEQLIPPIKPSDELSFIF